MKDDKTLLQEGTIRRFMKLAGTQPLASDFVNENYPVYKEDEEPREEADVDEYDAGEEEGEEGDQGSALRACRWAGPLGRWALWSSSRPRFARPRLALHCTNLPVHFFFLSLQWQHACAGDS